MEGKQTWQFTCGAEEEWDATNLLHDTSFPLGESDVPTRLVADELDLNLATLTTALIIVVFIVIRGTLSRTLDTATLGCTAIGLRIVEFGGRRLVVLFCDVGHCFCLSGGSRYHESIKVINGGDAVLSLVPMVYT